MEAGKTINLSETVLYIVTNYLCIICFFTCINKKHKSKSRSNTNKMACNHTNQTIRRLAARTQQHRQEPASGTNTTKNQLTLFLATQFFSIELTDEK